MHRALASFQLTQPEFVQHPIRVVIEPLILLQRFELPEMVLHDFEEFRAEGGVCRRLGWGVAIQPFEACVEKLLARDPKDRFQTAAEARDAIEGCRM